MARSIRDAEERSWRRASLIALVAAAALLVAGVILAVVNERAYKAQKTDEVLAEAQFLALISIAALDFHDRAAAQELVDGLKANPEVEAAAIYDQQATLIASYSRDATIPLPARPPSGGTLFEKNRLIVAMPVIQDSVTIGSVYLDVLTEPFAQRLQRYLGVGVLVTMAALLVVVFGSMQAALRKANAELAKRADDLEGANRQLIAQIAQREKAEQALQQAQKMEAIGRLTGGVAHDFNNLLTIVAGNLDLLERLTETKPAKDLPRERLQRLVQAAQRGLARGERLTRQLLAFSRQQPVEARIVDINAMLDDFAPLIRHALGETIELQLQPGGERWLCAVDPAQFEAAILNLAINARDACVNGGTLAITTAPEPPLDGAAGAIARSRPMIMLTISDTGAGMPADVLARMFEPFFTTKPVGKGSGLGLAQVWAFVNQSGGRIEADSEPGRGTTFRLYFPVAADSREEAAEPPAAEAERGGSERILVVEDEDEVRDVAATTLERLGYRTVVARDGPEALEVLKRQKAIDLLFTDYVMPGGLNGGALARKALRLQPQLKVLITSGYARDASTSADNSRVDGFPMIAKPYRSAELAARIRRLLDHVEVERSG